MAPSKMPVILGVIIGRLLRHSAYNGVLQSPNSLAEPHIYSSSREQVVSWN